MRRIFMCIVLSLVMCLCMVLPAFAANVNLPASGVLVMDTYLSYNGWDSNYPYRLVFYNLDTSTITVFCFKTLTPENRSPVLEYYIVEDRVVPQSVISWYGIRKNDTGIPWSYGRWRNYLGSETVSYSNFTYIIENHTTVNLPLSNSPAGVPVNNVNNAGYANTDKLRELLAVAKQISDMGYTSSSWQSLQSQIISSQNLLNNNNSTQSQINSQVNSLQSAINGLTLAPILPDTTELRALVAEADAITDIGYTGLTWSRFTTARASGHNLLARSTYTELEVQAATVELTSAIGDLTLLPDTTELRALLVDADLIENDGYTSSSWNRFASARKNAHDLLKRTDFTANDVHNAYTELLTSLFDLEYPPVDPPIDPPVEPPIEPPVKPPQDYPETTFESFLGTEIAETYLDMEEGFTLAHLFPAVAGIEENMSEARKFAIWIFVAILVVYITTRILRTVVFVDSVDAIGGHEKIFNIGMNDAKRSALASRDDLSRKERDSLGSEYQGTYLRQANLGEKYIDW